MLTFKSYDLNYLRGMISKMKPDYKGSSQIPKAWKYVAPKEPDGKLADDIRALYLYEESDYQHVTDLLKQMNRVPVPVCMNLVTNNIDIVFFFLSK